MGGRGFWLGAFGVAIVAAVLVGCGGGGGGSMSPWVYGNSPVLASPSTGSVFPDGSSFEPSLNGSGRYVAFSSYATNLVDGGTATRDVYRYDRETGTMMLVTQALVGASDGFSSRPSVSDDGRYVAFDSYASNLVEGGTATGQVYVTDMATGVTSLVSCTESGAPGNGNSSEPFICGNGSAVAYCSEATDLKYAVRQVYLRNLAAGTGTLVSTGDSGPANAGCSEPRMSDDGRYTAFVSYATNLHASATSGDLHLYVRDGTDGSITVEDRATDGTLADSYLQQDYGISGDGRYIVFSSRATNLDGGNDSAYYRVYLRDRVTGTTTGISTAGEQCLSPSINDDGSYVLYRKVRPLTSDANIFVYDVATGQHRQVDTLPSGEGAAGNCYTGLNPISDVGAYITFASTADLLDMGGSTGTTSYVYVFPNPFILEP